jgi:small subunit ribosomal protein S16
MKTGGLELMAVKIRLARGGRKKRPFYRIVVASSEAPRDGRFIENIGTYDPLPVEIKVNIDSERLQYWLGQGAKPTDTVSSLIRKYAKLS